MILKFCKRILTKVLNTPLDYKNVSVQGQVSGIHNVNFKGGNKIGSNCNFSGEITVDYRTTLGNNNYLHGKIQVGKYCQFGADVALHATNHPSTYLSTYINKNLFNGELKSLKQEGKIIVGHDVWLGHSVVIVGNVNIGNGAIIAAGAVVTKDVEPFSLVAGVPSKKIKMRFSDEIIEEIQELKWWDMNDEELENKKALFFRNLKDLKTIY
ncbi:DapH/DapD/GlmU-related protein [Urechidicola sp. KH5]